MSQADTDPIEHNKDLNAQSFDQKPRQRDNNSKQPTLSQDESQSQLNGNEHRHMSERSIHSAMIGNGEDNVMYYVNKRKKIQQDVTLLHNRIRMLRMEEEKAMKKIQETRKKAQEIMDLKRRNDEIHEMKIKAKSRENKRNDKKKEKRFNEFNERKMQMEERKNQIQNERRKVAQSLRIKRMQNDQRKMNLINELRMKNAAKKELVKTQERQAFIRLENMKRKQIIEAKDLVLDEKEIIRKRELEAQRLERLEAELLQNLQQTQHMEREAFTQLEHAMIDASKPKRDRVTRSRLSKRSENPYKKDSKKSVL